MKTTLHFVRVQFIECGIKTADADVIKTHKVEVTFAETAIPYVAKDEDDEDTFKFGNKLVYSPRLDADDNVKGGIRAFLAVLGRHTELMELGSALATLEDHQYGMTEREINQALTGSEWELDVETVDAGSDVTIGDQVYTYTHAAVRKDVLSVVLDSDIEEEFEDYVDTITSTRCTLKDEKAAKKSLRAAVKSAEERMQKTLAKVAADAAKEEAAVEDAAEDAE